MKKILFLSFAVLFSLQSFGQSRKDIKRVYNFMNSLKNKEKSLNEISTKFLCNASQKREGGDSLSSKDMVDQTLAALRQDIDTMDFSKLTVVQYSKLKDDDRNLMFGDNSYDPYIYRVQYDGKTLINVFMKEKKIYSFTTMMKGETGVMMFYCDPGVGNL